MATQSRIPPLPPDQWDPEVRPIIEGASARVGRPLNIMATFANHPKLLKRWSVLANHTLAKSTLPPREREVLILRTGFRCGSDYEWGQHVGIGREAGLSDAEIEQITKGPKAGWSRHEAALVQAADDLFENSVVSDETWKILAETYSTHQMMDLVFSIGQYNLVSWVLNSFGVPLDDFLPGAQQKVNQ